MTQIHGLVAVSQNRVIGKDGKMPWHKREDLRHLKRITMGHVLIMGRSTWDSLPGPLEGRTMIVLSRDALFYPDPSGALVARSKEKALRLAEAAGGTIWIFGGSQIYKLFEDDIQKWFVTEVHEEHIGDAFFPPLDSTSWDEQTREPHPDGFDWVTFERK